MQSNLLSILLRALTLASKFLLLIAFAKYFSVEELGIYGLFVVTISFFMYLIGFDFYAYTSRELLSQDKNHWASLIRDQLIFYFFSYLLFLPLLSGIFFWGFLDWKYMLWFYCILLLEHLSFEGYRLLIIMQYPVKANVILFIRSASWLYLVIAILYFCDECRTLNLVWAGWTAGLLVGLFITIKTIASLNWEHVREKEIQWKWIKKGVKVSAIFLINTLALRAMFTFDRYFIKHFHGEAMVGVYTFYISIYNAMTSFLDAGVISIYYPKIVEKYKQHDFRGFLQETDSMNKAMIITIVLLILFFSVAIKPLLMIVDKAIYLNHIEIFPVFIAILAVWGMSFIPHYTLYASGGDKKLMLSSIIGMLVSLILFFILIPQYSITGAAYALLGSVITMALLKYSFAYKAKSNIHQRITDQSASE